MSCIRVRRNNLLTGMLQQAEPISRVREVWVADIGPEVRDEMVLEFVEAVDLAVGQISGGLGA